MRQPTPLIRQPVWTGLEKIGFRFSFIFFGLYIFPFPLETLPYGNLFLNWYNDLWNHLISITGRNILHISYHFNVNLAGDSTAGYITLLVTFFAGVIGAGIWTFLDRKK